MLFAKNALRLGAAAIALALAAAPVVAREFRFEPEKAGVEMGLSTLGTYVAPTYALNSRVSLRAPFHFGDYEGEDSYDGNDLSYKFDLASSAIFVDYKPFEGKFRISAGLGFGGYEAGTTVTDPTLDGTTFPGTYDFKLEQKSDVTPMLAMGYVQPLGKRLSLVGELGGKITTYRVGTDLDAISDPLLRAEMAEEIAEINRDLKDINVTPFATLGVAFRF